MVTKTDAADRGKGSKIKIKTLKLEKETVKDLTGDESRKVKGGGYTAFCGDRKTTSSV